VTRSFIARLHTPGRPPICVHDAAASWLAPRRDSVLFPQGPRFVLLPCRRLRPARGLRSRGRQSKGEGQLIVSPRRRHRKCACSSLGWQGSPSCSTRTVTPPPTPHAVIVPARASPLLRSTLTVTWLAPVPLGGEIRIHVSTADAVHEHSRCVRTSKVPLSASRQKRSRSDRPRACRMAQSLGRRMAED